MTFDIELHDADQARTYHLTVFCKVRPESDGARQYCVDIDRVWLEEAVIYFDKQGSEVQFCDYENRLAAARFIERKYAKEIRELCIQAFERERSAA